MNERATRIKRIIYRSWHRGCKETDVVLGPFAETRLAGSSDAELDVFEALLEENDSDIWNWLVGKDYGYDRKYRPLIESLQRFTEEQHAV